MVLLPATFAAWAAVALAVLVLNDTPVASLLPLAVLAGGFEAIHALHVGVERIGRYLQVYYEQGAGLPRWETTAMAVGPALPGGGIDPLFSVIFVCAAMVNLLPVVTDTPLLDTALAVIAHAAFVFRVVRARGAAARQRAVELESFRALQMSERNGP